MPHLETDCDKNKESFSPKTSASSFTTLSLLMKKELSFEINSFKKSHVLLNFAPFAHFVSTCLQIAFRKSPIFFF